MAAGKPRSVLLRYNDREDVERLFAEHDDIAAVVVEPVLANAGCILPAPGYLQHLQAVARRNGALVILDEVLMGYRLHAGLTGTGSDLDPDLATVGKAIGSGIAVAAVCRQGRADVADGGGPGRPGRDLRRQSRRLRRGRRDDGASWPGSTTGLA